MPPKTQSLKYDVNKINYIENEKQETKIAKFDQMPILGQINKMYILCASQEGLVIFDQHVVEERANYESFLNYFEKKQVPVQNLLQPQIINLTQKEHTIIINHKDELYKLGFEIDDYGNNAIIVRTTPTFFKEIEPSFITDLISEVVNISAKNLHEVFNEKIIRFSCKRSVKAGKELTIIQMQQMIENLRYCKDPFTCPHGRPIMLKISYSELEKMFKRKE